MPIIIKNLAAVIMGSMTSERKRLSSRENGKKGGYWKQERNKHKLPTELNRKYETTIDVDSLVKSGDN